MRYVYSIIRFVPEPARGEFINVGAIVGSEESDEWQIRQISNPTRARAIDERKSLDAVWSFINRVGAEIDAFDAWAGGSLFEPEIALDEEWLRDLHSRHQSVVQLSEPAPIVSDSADEALEAIFNLVVLDPARREHAAVNKNRAVAKMRHAYRHSGISKDKDLFERIPLRTEHHRTRLDFAVVNGQAVQLTQAWSFQVSDQELLAEQVKAWGWTIQDARENGGSLTSVDNYEIEVPREVSVRAVYMPADADQPAPAFRDAVHIFDALNIHAVPLSEVTAVASDAAVLLGKKGTL